MNRTSPAATTSLPARANMEYPASPGRGILKKTGSLRQMMGLMNATDSDNESDDDGDFEWQKMKEMMQMPKNPSAATGPTGAEKTRPTIRRRHSLGKMMGLAADSDDDDSDGGDDFEGQKAKQKRQPMKRRHSLGDMAMALGGFDGGDDDSNSGKDEIDRDFDGANKEGGPSPTRPPGGDGGEGSQAPPRRKMRRRRSFGNLIKSLGEEACSDDSEEQEEKKNEALKTVDLYKMAKESAVKPKTRRKSIELYLGLAEPDKEEQMLDQLRKREADRRARMAKKADLKKKELAEAEQRLHQQSMERLRQRHMERQQAAQRDNMRRLNLLQSKKQWTSASAADQFRDIADDSSSSGDDESTKDGDKEKSSQDTAVTGNQNESRRKPRSRPRRATVQGNRPSIVRAAPPPTSPVRRRNSMLGYLPSFLAPKNASGPEAATKKKPPPPASDHKQLPKDAGLDLYTKGQACASQHKWKEALAYYHKALVLQRKANGADHLSCGHILNDTGVALRNIGEYFGAKTALEEALYIRQLHLGMGDAQVAETTNNMWRVMDDFQQQQEKDDGDQKDGDSVGGDSFDVGAGDVFGSGTNGCGEDGSAKPMRAPLSAPQAAAAPPANSNENKSREDGSACSGRSNDGGGPSTVFLDAYDDDPFEGGLPPVQTVEFDRQPMATEEVVDGGGGGTKNDTAALAAAGELVSTDDDDDDDDDDDCDELVEATRRASMSRMDMMNEMRKNLSNGGL